MTKAKILVSTCKSDHHRNVGELLAHGSGIACSEAAFAALARSLEAKAKQRTCHFSEANARCHPIIPLLSYPGAGGWSDLT